MTGNEYHTSTVTRRTDLVRHLITSLLRERTIQTP